jgi:hypothetical protein
MGGDAIYIRIRRREKMDGHHHENLKKLERGLPYLLAHNREHEKEIEKWIQRAKESHQDAVAGDLQKVLELSKKISELFENAIENLPHED